MHLAHDYRRVGRVAVSSGVVEGINITTGIERRSSGKPGLLSTLLSNGEHAKNDKTAG